MKNNSKLKMLIVITLFSFVLMQCMKRMISENGLDLEPSETIISGDSWKTADAVWQFKDDGKLEIVGINKTETGYWYLQENTLEVMLGEEVTSYDISVISEGKIRLNSRFKTLELEK